MANRIEKTSQPWSKVEAWLGDHVYEIISLLILITGLIFFMCHQNYDLSSPIDSSIWGQYGDYVGGLIGTLLAYVSIKLLNRNLQEQIKANKKLQESNELNQKVALLQQLNDTFATLFELYQTHPVKKDPINICELRSFNYQGNVYKDRVKEATNKFYDFYVENRSKLSSYFRLLYRIMQIIDEAEVAEDIKKRYVKIFRCQLTEDELFLLRYNASTHYGKKMQVYINRYNLLKHLPKTRLMEFKNLFVGDEIVEYENLLDQIVNTIRKTLVDKLSVIDGIDDKNQHNNSKKLNDIQITYDITKSSVKISLIYQSSQLKISDDTLQMFLRYFILDTFVYSLYEHYQTESSLEIEEDIIKEMGSQKHTVWISLKSKEGYLLVFSQRQLNEPQK